MKAILQELDLNIDAPYQISMLIYHALPSSGCTECPITAVQLHI